MAGILPTGSPEGDRTALVVLYEGTDGDNWRHSWDVAGNISTWYGVTVNGEGRVVKLSLNANNLRGPIPGELGTLGALRRLSLSGNQLSGPIPRELGNLTALTILYLHDNKLSGTIPAALGQLGKLETLDLSVNELEGAIPRELGKLNALGWLNLSKNKLTGIIPPELANLGALRFLNLSYNNLSGIPKVVAERFEQIPKLEVDLFGNPWAEPSWEVVRGGWSQIISYYEALQLSGATTFHRLKVVLVGAVGDGKTSLARGLREGKPTPTTEKERTRGVDIRPWRPDPAHPLEVVMWDFAGHAEYYSTHQLFLTEGALQLLFVDLHKFHGDPPSRGEAVYIWLDALLCRVPGCAVLIVATHADRFNGDREQVAASLNDLQAKICEHVKAKRKEWDHAVKIKQRTAQSRDQSVEAPPSLYLCGCVEASGLFDKTSAVYATIFVA